MKCEMPGSRRELDPDNTFETDAGGKYKRVCGKCYEKLTGAAVTQAGAGRRGSTEGKTSKVGAAPDQLVLALA